MPAPARQLHAWVGIPTRWQKWWLRSPAGLGDVNGDGWEDFGVVRWSTVDGDKAAVWVVHGRPGLADLPLDELEPEDVGLRIASEIPADIIVEVFAGGDINGDGLDDVVINDSEYTQAPVGPGLPTPEVLQEGAAWVVWGRSERGELTLEAIEGSAEGYVIRGSRSWERIYVYPPDPGVGVADYNGDGLGDLVVGAKPSDSEPRRSYYVVFGKADGASQAIPDVWAEGGAIEVYDPEDGVDYQVTMVGDFDGDGHPDLGAGADEAALVLFGRASPQDINLLDVEAGDAEVGIRIWPGPGSGLWTFVHGPVGDVNGDGYADLVVDDSRDPYLVFGGPDRVDLDLWDANTPGGRVWRLENRGAETFTATALGDVDGDGDGDFVLALASPNSAPIWHSCAQLVPGRPGLGVGEPAVPLAPCTRWLEVYSVTRCDTDGDGVPEVLVQDNGHIFGHRLYP